MALIKDSFKHFDTSFFLWIHSKSMVNDYSKIIRLISKTGDGWLYTILTLLLVLYNPAKYSVFFTITAFAYFLELSMQFLLKKKFKRNRPQNHILSFTAKINPVGEFSFPSGHTASAFVMATILSVYFPVLTPLFLFWALMIGISRILLGVHFPGDILAGIFLGVVSATTSLALFS